MTQRQPNLIDTIAGFIPGYRGYAARETRRAQDKRLREHVAGVLDRGKRRLDQVALELVDAGRLEPLDDLDRLRRVFGRCADTLRFAEAGGSGLMDDVVVKDEDLDRVHAHDLTLLESAQALATAAEALTAATAEDGVAALRTQAEQLLRSIESRATVLAQEG